VSVDWSCVDERLIRQGELLLSLDFLESYECELRRMNRGKVGRPYTLTDKYVEFLVVVRYLSCFPYRQLEGSPEPSTGLFQSFPHRIIQASEGVYSALTFHFMSL